MEIVGSAEEYTENRKRKMLVQQESSDVITEESDREIR